MLFKSYFSLPSELMNYLCCAFDLRTEWFASALDRNTLLPFYASKGRADDGFASLGIAYIQMDRIRYSQSRTANCSSYEGYAVGNCFML